MLTLISQILGFAIVLMAPVLILAVASALHVPSQRPCPATGRREYARMSARFAQVAKAA